MAPAAATRTTTTWGEAAAVVTICFGLFILGSVEAMFKGFPADDGYFNNGQLWSLIATEVVCGGFALILLSKRGFAVAALAPRPSVKGTARGVALFAAAWLLAWILTAPFDSSSQQPISRMVSGSSPSLILVVLMSLVNAAFEEGFLLGYLLRGLRAYGLAMALGVSLLVRVGYHLYQGPLGALSILGIGFAFSIAYMRRADLWPPVLAHAIFDVAVLSGVAS